VRRNGVGAFDDFYRNEYSRLVAAVALVCGDVHRARDAVDEAVARAVEQERRGVRIESLGAWVRTVALNVARSRGRRQGAESRAHDRLLGAITARAHEADLERAIDVGRALEHLPHRQREAVVLHYLYDLSVDDVAATLGVSAGTVKTSLHRARAALAALLDAEVV
jgi:RNA polymerase sigma factor (sigma-70 family)